MNIEINQVYTFKLNSGEEVISKVKSVDGQFISLEEPVSVAPSPQGMGLIPSLFTAKTDDFIKLNTNSITMYGPTDDNVRNKYVEATTGLSVPSKKIVLG